MGSKPSSLAKGTKPDAPSPPAPSPPAPSPPVPAPAGAAPGQNTRLRSASQYLEDEAREEEYLRNLQAIAQVEFRKRGPLCDSEGYYQHTGECWHDSVQQIIFNTDGIKEDVQTFFITTVIDLEYHTRIPDRVFVPKEVESDEARSTEFIRENKDYINELKKWITLYLRESQKRFFRHYIQETKRRVIKQEVCLLDEPEVAEVARAKILAIARDPAFRKEGKEAQMAVIFGTKSNLNKEKPTVNKKYAYKSTREAYIKEEFIRGGYDTDVRYIFDIVDRLILGGDKLTITEVDRRYFEFYKNDPKLIKYINSLKAMYFVGRRFSRDNTLERVATPGKEGHAVAFYQCGNKQYFYDDNFGIFPFDWKHFFIMYIRYLENNQQPIIQQAKLYLRDPTHDLLLYTDKYPVIHYIDSDGRYHTELMLVDRFIEANDGTQRKDFSFRRQIESLTVNLTVYSEEMFEFSEALCFQSSIAPKNGRFANYGFQWNSRARIQRIQDNPIAAALEGKDRISALEAIEALPVDPDLSYPLHEGGRIPIIHLAMNRQLEDVAIRLVQKGYNYKLRFRGFDAFAWALDFNHLLVARAILEKDPTILTESTIKGKPVLHLLSSFDTHKRAVHFLLESGANVEAKAPDGLTPLFYAAHNKALDNMKLLCKYGANSRAKSPKGKTPAEFTTDAGIIEFLKNSCDSTRPLEVNLSTPAKNAPTHTSLLEAIVDKDTPYALKLIETLPVNPELSYLDKKHKDKPNIPVVGLALSKGLESVAIRLIQRGYDFQSHMDKNHNSSDTIFRYALNKKYIQVVNVILDVDRSILSDFDSINEILSVTLQDDKYLDITKRIIWSSANEDLKDGRSLLGTAVYYWQPKTLEYLCSKGADINRRDRNGKLPIEYTRSEIVKEFLKKGCKSADAAKSPNQQIIQAILAKDKKTALKLIDTLPVEPELSYATELKLQDQIWYRYIPVIVLAINMDLNTVAVRLVQRGYSYKMKYLNEYNNLIGVINTIANSLAFDVFDAILVKEPTMLSEFINTTSLFSRIIENDKYLNKTKLLVEAGADINTSSLKHGFTPLTLAAYSGAFETVKYLCSKGPESINTAISYAANATIKQYLQEQCRAPPVNVRPAAAAPVVAAPVAPPPAAVPTKKANKPVKAKANTRPAGSNAPPARANTRPAGSNAPPVKPNNKTRRRKRGPRKRGQTKKTTAAP